MSIEQTTGTNKEDLSDYKGPEGIASRWLKEIELVLQSKEQKAYESIGTRIVRKYRNADSLEVTPGKDLVAPSVMLNLLWSNVQVLKPVLYARTPKALAQSRFEDPDPVTSLAAKIGERATSYMLQIQKSQFDNTAISAVEDRLLPGMGWGQIRYDVEFEPAKDENGQTLTDPETGEPVMAPKPGSQKAIPDYVYWKDVIHSIGRNYYEWRWIARRSFMTRAEMRRRFGQVANLVKLTHSPEEYADSDMGSKEQDFFKKAEIWEVWDKDSKQVIWVSKGLKDQPLDVKDDPLKLEGFFPFAKPLSATLSTDSSYPTPDYVLYQKLADDADYIAKRLSALIECVRVVGVAQASMQNELDDMKKLPDGSFKYVRNWAEFAEKGGLKGAIDWFPFDAVATAINKLMEYQSLVKSQVDEMAGIPDIVRGSSNPTETASAQQMKGKWTIIKTSEKQNQVQEWCRSLLQKMFEVIFEPGLFDDETIMMMTNYAQLKPEEQQIYPQALAILRDDKLKTFKIEIETDSTIAVDDEANKQNALEFMGALSQLYGSAFNIIQVRPELTTPMLEAAMHGVKSFRTARDLEASFESAISMIKENDQAQAEAAQQPQGPTPEEIKMQADLAYQQAQMQIDQHKAMLEEQKMQHTASLKEYETQQNLLIKQAQSDAELALKNKEIEYKSILNQKEMALEAAKIRLEMAQKQSEIIMSQTQGLIDEYKTKTREQLSKPIQLVMQSEPKKATSKHIVMDDGKGGVKQIKVNEVEE